MYIYTCIFSRKVTLSNCFPAPTRTYCWMKLKKIKIKIYKYIYLQSIFKWNRHMYILRKKKYLKKAHIYFNTLCFPPPLKWHSYGRSGGFGDPRERDPSVWLQIGATNMPGKQKLRGVPIAVKKERRKQKHTHVMYHVLLFTYFSFFFFLDPLLCRSYFSLFTLRPHGCVLVFFLACSLLDHVGILILVYSLTTLLFIFWFVYSYHLPSSKTSAPRSCDSCISRSALSLASELIIGPTSTPSSHPGPTLNRHSRLKQALKRVLNNRLR